MGFEKESSGNIVNQAKDLITFSNSGSSRNSGETILSQKPQPKVDEIPVAESDADNGPDCPIESLDKTIGDIIDEIVENFVPPVLQGVDEFFQVFVPRPLTFQHPNRQELSGFLPAVDFFEYGSELFFEQI